MLGDDAFNTDGNEKVGWCGKVDKEFSTAKAELWDLQTEMSTGNCKEEFRAG